MSGGGKNVFRIAACLVRPRGRDKSAGLQAGLFFLIYHENIPLGEFP